MLASQVQLGDAAWVQCEAQLFFREPVIPFTVVADATAIETLCAVKQPGSLTSLADQGPVSCVSMIVEVRLLYRLVGTSLQLCGLLLL